MDDESMNSNQLQEPIPVPLSPISINASIHHFQELVMHALDEIRHKALLASSEIAVAYMPSIRETVQRRAERLGMRGGR